MQKQQQPLRPLNNFEEKLEDFGFLNTMGTVLPSKSDSDFMLCLQSYQGLIIDISFVY